MLPFAACYKPYVRYRLSKEPKALAFTVLDQSPTVTAFLEEYGPYLTSTGLKVDVSHYPEFKDSRNIIYLQGDGSRADNLAEDYTTFTSDYARDNKAELIEAAIQEVVDFLKGKPARTLCSDVRKQALNIPGTIVGITNERESGNVYICKPYSPRRKMFYFI